MSVRRADGESLALEADFGLQASRHFFGDLGSDGAVVDGHQHRGATLSGLVGTDCERAGFEPAGDALGLGLPAAVSHQADRICGSDVFNGDADWSLLGREQRTGGEQDAGGGQELADAWHAYSPSATGGKKRDGGPVSISPARDVAAGRGGLQKALDDLGGVHLVIAQAADCVGLFGIAVPAMLGPIAVEHLSAVGRVGRLLEEVFHQVDGVIEVIIVHIADVDVDLAFEVLADLGPVALERWRGGRSALSSTAATSGSITPVRLSQIGLG